MDSFSFANRPNLIQNVKDTRFDVIVIGGGITGAGIFLDAQSRGLKCCLIEMQDFSEGSSSRSTKLIHGGLRYLKQWNFNLVKETGEERNVVEYIARHLTHPIKVMLPAIKDGNFSKFQLKLALWVYEILAKVPTLLRHKSYSFNQFASKVVGIEKRGLRGGIEYIEYQTNDSRLTIEIIKKGVSLGGIALNRVKAIDFSKDKKGRIRGVKACDNEPDNQFLIYSSLVINATGSWVDQLLKVKNKSFIAKIKPTKGVHLVVEKVRFPLAEAIYFDAPDKRMIFAIPQDDIVYFGTTDTFFGGDIARPDVTKDDIVYLLDACNKMFPEIHLTASDITGAWAGVRPLIYEKDKKPSEISRKYEIYQEKSGLLTITGGKLTGYRKMAQKIVDLAIVKHFKTKKLKDCNTANIRLFGSDFEDDNDYQLNRSNFIDKAKKYNWSEREYSFVWNHFGSQSDEILNIKNEKQGDLPDYLFKSLMFTLENEMVMCPADFFNRRTNLFYFHQDLVQKYYTQVAAIIYEYNNLSKEHQTIENQNFQKILEELADIRKG